MNDFDEWKYKEWLRNNTSLRENSISLYARTANAFFKEHDELNLENINAYVTKSFRKSNSAYVKYSFRPLLEFYGFELDDENVPKLYRKIVRVKQKPKKKRGTYLPKDMILKIIDCIDHEVHRDIARLQYATGARAHEIIRIREENIDFDYSDTAIRIWLTTKGDNEGVTFVAKDYYEQIIEKYCNGKPGFIFLDNAAIYDDEELTRAINTKRDTYNAAIRKSVQGLGIERFGTHDFRRNFTDALDRSGASIRTIQKALNHRNIRTTMGYFSGQREDVKSAVIEHQGTNKGGDSNV